MNKHANPQKEQAKTKKPCFPYLAAFVLLLSQSAHATVSLSTRANASVYGNLVIHPGVDSASAAVSDALSSSAASASAKYGVLKVKTQGSVTNSAAVHEFSSAYARSEYTDEVTISTSAYPDGWLFDTTLNFAFYYTLTARNPLDTLYPFPVTGGAYSDFFAYASATSYAYSRTTSYVSHLVQLTSGQGVSYRDESSDVFSPPASVFRTMLSLAVPIRNNEPFEVNFAIQASGYARDMLYSGTDYFVADASHSGYWAGISSLTADNIPLREYSITSASGTDYSHSMVPQQIPEPGLCSILFTGALGMLWNLRRRA